MDLAATLATLQLNDASTTPSTSEDETSSLPRRSARLQSKPPDSDIKKRVLTKPTKITEEGQDVENYYLDKRIKRLSPSLETIYEDISENSMSLKKFRRSINFSTGIIGLKVRKRKMKVKSVPAQFRVKNNKKLSLAVLFEKLQNVDK